MLAESSTLYSKEAAVAVAKRRCTSKQGVRMAEYLVSRGGVMTGELAAAIACANLSAAAAKVRPHLEALGWTITARPPAKRIKNRFGEISQANVWQLERLR